MIHVERAQDMIQKISTTYDEVQKQTNSALVLHNFPITFSLSLHD